MTFQEIPVFFLNLQTLDQFHFSLVLYRKFLLTDMAIMKQLRSCLYRILCNLRNFISIKPKSNHFVFLLGIDCTFKTISIFDSKMLISNKDVQLFRNNLKVIMKLRTSARVNV